MTLRSYFATGQQKIMQCEIKWNFLSLVEWEERFSRIRRANLLQSYDYARAVCPLHHQKARWGVIFIDGREAGMVQILEAGLPGNVLHAVILDRGPLWFDGFGSQEHINAFFCVFDHEFPQRFGRRRRLLPEAEVELKGFKRVPKPGYQTIWIDLRQDPEEIRSGFDKKWRNALSKAERSGLSVEWDETGEFLPSLLTNYQLDKAKKGYSGPSPALLRQMAKSFGSKGLMLIGHAIPESSRGNSGLADQAIAAILVLCHGRAATYQIGWSLRAGREKAAHNFLLWQAICHLKNKGFWDLDLGGVNDDAQGIKKFKKGMGGQMVTYAGQYM